MFNFRTPHKPIPSSGKTWNKRWISILWFVPFVLTSSNILYGSLRSHTILSFFDSEWRMLYVKLKCKHCLRSTYAQITYVPFGPQPVVIGELHTSVVYV